MVTIERKQYCIDMLEYASKYATRLKQGLLKHSTYVDADYMRDIIEDLGSFAPIIRMECLNDMTLLHTDTKIAGELKSMYTDFGDYCYDMLKTAYDATNETLLLCNQLYYDIVQVLSPEHIDVAVATNYIAFNAFGKGGTVELTNFKRLSGIGLCYDILVKQQGIATSNVQEKMQARLAYFAELGEVISQLNNETQLFQLIDKWSENVNDKLLDIKNNALPAWIATYYAYNWQQLDLTKQNALTYCNLSVQPKKVVEALFNKGRSKRVDYGVDYAKVLQLDYLNNANFDFK